MATRILSTPTTVSVFAGALPDNWGSGSAAGTFAADVWTPGRDADGIVNLVSWNLVPFNRWIEVAGTRLDGLDPVVKAAVPGWVDRGNSKWNGVTDAWNGVAWDERAGFERGWLTVCGGHADSSNDGIYRMDFRKMDWVVQRMPTDPSWWPAGYDVNWSGGFKTFPSASNYYAANNANAEGVFWDELFTPGDPGHSPRTPTARHTYGSCVFVPSLGAAGKILMGCLRYWEYDLGTNAWAIPKFPFGNAAGYDASKGYAGENMQGWFNEVENRYYLCATQNANASQTWSVSPGGSGWRWEGGYPVGGYWSFVTAQEKIGRVLWTLVYHADVAANGKPMYMRRVNLDTRAVTDFQVALGATLAGKTFTDFWDGQGMTFVPELNKWLCNVSIVNMGMVWCWLDATTWVLEIANVPGLSATGGGLLVENKIKYFPDMHAVVWVKTASENVRLIRFA